MKATTYYYYKLMLQDKTHSGKRESLDQLSICPNRNFKIFLKKKKEKEKKGPTWKPFFVKNYSFSCGNLVVTENMTHKKV